MSGPGKGKKGLYAEVAEELLAAFREYAKGRGETLGEAVARAMRREMASPPAPVKDPPLPPYPPKKPRR